MNPKSIQSIFGEYLSPQPIFWLRLSALRSVASLRFNGPPETNRRALLRSVFPALEKFGDSLPRPLQ